MAQNEKLSIERDEAALIIIYLNWMVAFLFILITLFAK